MNILRELRQRFAQALRPLLTAPATDQVSEEALVDLVRQSQDPKFGDYQGNMAMSLGKQLGRPPRDVAGQIVENLDVADTCRPPEIAGPGFINLALREDWLAQQLRAAVDDPRLSIAPVASPRTVIVDYSAPNVAKPMHVGHIRSTVIGDCIYRTLQFLGHRAIGDNHIGDWGTQFGMIIYGYKHFRDSEAYERSRVAELARLYRLVNTVIDYFDGRRQLPTLEKRAAEATETLAGLKAAPATGDAKADKKAAQTLRRAESDASAARGAVEDMRRKFLAFEADATLSRLAKEHPNIDSAVLAETAKLHSGDAENLELWRQFMPDCMAAINRLYVRLGVKFDETLGESFYHDRLQHVVEGLIAKGVARESDGAICVFLEGSPAPMIIRKKDGAFLYATTDLATIEYRRERWNPDAMLYVTDHRQSLHFEQLFATARKIDYENVEFAHVNFGTVLGDDGRPFKTRSGDTVGLEGLLGEAVERAHKIVSESDDAKPDGRELSDEARHAVAQKVGIGALKYADLSQNRTSDYVFSYDKMLAMNGNTATYMQYAYARVRSIFRRGGVDIEALRKKPAPILLTTPAERALGIEILRFAEALDAVLVDYRPNQLTAYLFELANRYSTFFDQCPVLKAETDELRTSRLLLCDLTARTLKQGLELLGIDVVEQM